MSADPGLEAPQLADEQIELVDELCLPVRPDLELMAAERSFLPARAPKLFTHTGAFVIRRLQRDQDLLEAVCSALLLGLSARLIGKRFGLSPKSVVRIREAMTGRGELAPVRIRIQQKLDRVIEDGLDRWHEGIIAGEVHPGQLGIPILAAIDKRGQLEAGLVPGTQRTVEEITVERVLQAREALRLVAGAGPENPGPAWVAASTTDPGAEGAGQKGPAEMPGSCGRAPDPEPGPALAAVVELAGPGPGPARQTAEHESAASVPDPEHSGGSGPLATGLATVRPGPDVSTGPAATGPAKPENARPPASVQKEGGGSASTAQPSLYDGPGQEKFSALDPPKFFYD